MASDFAEEIYNNDIVREGRIKYILNLAEEVIDTYPKEIVRRGIELEEDEEDYVAIEEVVESICIASGIELTPLEVEEVYRLWYN